jgi:hypothetical protein
MNKPPGWRFQPTRKGEVIMSTDAREQAAADIREQVQVIWSAARGAPLGGDIRRELFLSAARMERLADEIEAPGAPAWLLDMLHAGTAIPSA